ncbi:MAG: dihydrodipicolinate synthase family protein [Chloroflexota bacterium]|nr:dihydrodipicolinate synthase family protein [Chloroflexota bacterium]
MTPTTFNKDGSIDEDAFRVHLRRLVAAKTGLFLPGGGAGEGHVLTPKEMGRLYRVGVEEARGKVPVYAGCRESRSAAALLEIATEAERAGVDLIQMYQLDNGHGMIPTQREQEAYWYELLDTIKTPVAISIHYDAKFKATPEFMQRLVKKYDHIVALNVVGSAIGWFIMMRAELPERIKFYVGAPEFIMHSTLGAAGYINPSNNMIPFTCRALVDAWNREDYRMAAKANGAIQRFLAVMNQWAPSTARWVKMAMKVMGTGNGVLRLPYVLPPEEELKKMSDQMDALRVREIEAEARDYVLKA